MNTAVALGLVALGVALLGVGAESLVRGAAAIARLARIPPAVIGLTIVAVGTSLPELTVGVTAALTGRASIGVGNVMGVNVFNICAVLGVTALVQPIRVHGSAVRLEWPIMFVAAWQCLLLVRDGALDRLEGGYFVMAMGIFLAFAIRIGRRDVSAEEASDLAEQLYIRSFYGRLRRFGPSLALVGAGSVLLFVGGTVLVRAAASLAQQVGMTERMIGLTVVAIGTGMPELAASIAAARRGQSELALGNVIGSNIANVFGILGIVSLLRPIEVDASLVLRDAWWMVGATVLLLPIMRRKSTVTRAEGLLLLAVYGVYLGTLRT